MVASGLALIWPLSSASRAADGVSAPAEPAPRPQPQARPRVLDWETGENKSYVVPAADIVGFLTALNVFNRNFLDPHVYGTTARGTLKQVRKWSLDYDDDPFNVNQFGHPVEGAIMYGAARSAGLKFWESLFYSNVGSVMWETAGETEPPSFNDLVTTGQAGSLLGEALFRSASLLLENDGRHPGFWRELGASVIMPSLGFNRWVYGARFKPVFTSHRPPVFWHLRLGATADLRARDSTVADIVRRQEVAIDFLLAYGQPGKPGYTYDRPFDYFQLEFGALTSAHTHNWLENLFCRGLLWGRSYELGSNYTGVLGAYGLYDFASPQIFRVSSTAGGVGTTMEWWPARQVAVQSSLIGGVGFAGAGTNPIKNERDYHYGVTPQGLASVRIIFGERAAIDVSGRGYYISGTGSDDTLGTETIWRGKAGLTVRLYDRNALGIQFVASRRDSRYNARPSTHQSVGTFSLTYTYLGNTRFGAVGSFAD